MKLRIYEEMWYAHVQLEFSESYAPFELRLYLQLISFVSTTPMKPFNRMSWNFAKDILWKCVYSQDFPRGLCPFWNWPKLNKLLNQFVITTPLKSSTKFRESLLLQRRYCVNAQIHSKSFWGNMERGKYTILWNLCETGSGREERRHIVSSSKMSWTRTRNNSLLTIQNLCKISTEETLNYFFEKCLFTLKYIMKYTSGTWVYLYHM